MSESALQREPITRLLELLTADYTGPMPTWRTVDSAASSALFPVERVNGRRYISRADLPKIAALYGLAPKAPPAPRASRKAVSARVPVAA